jgi:hypothetical protein
VVPSFGRRLEAGFRLAENKLGLRPKSGSARGVAGMEMCEKHRLRVKLQPRKVAPKDLRPILPVL